MGKRSLATLVVVHAVGVFAVWAQAGSAFHGPINRSSFEAPSTANTGAPSSALLSMLGVLRRPQRPSDELNLASLHLGEGVYVGYTRLARVVAGTSYYVIPVAKPNCSEPEELIFEQASPDGFGSSGGATPALIADGKLYGTCCQGPTAVVSGVVPDRVAKVSISYPKSGHLRAVTITTKPVENVFVVTVPRESTVASLPRLITPRSAKGKLITAIRG